ncbi:MAG: hypothetical protein NT026_02060 [Candidatus Staskawiczbacteria bacterium]|nr:hypothetical protein [Candidatus Staskawiczbacteria bacterium]
MFRRLPKPPIKKEKGFLPFLGRTISKVFKLIVAVFALAGFGLIFSYVAVNQHWTDTNGIIDKQSDVFWQDSKTAAALSSADIGESDDIFFNKANFCYLKAVKESCPAEFRRIINLAMEDKKDLAQKNLDSLLITLNLKSCDTDAVPSSVSKQDFEELAGMVDLKSPFKWANFEEWSFFKAGALKDKDILSRIETETGIKSRVLVSQLMAEQLRLFYSDRPSYKKVVEPLKVLGSMTQFSWGIFGIKPETAIEIENNLKDEKSPYYLGKGSENLLDFKTENVSKERFDRMTDYKDHYYSYLYAALLNKEITTQWQKAGFDVSNRPEILATLFNIGFNHSNPGPNPQVGGSELKIGDQSYSFGRLSYEFYYSGELLDEFPQ